MSTKKHTANPSLEEISPEDRQFILENRELPSPTIRERLGNRYTWQQIAWVKARATMKEQGKTPGPKKLEPPTTFPPPINLPILPTIDFTNPASFLLQQGEKRAKPLNPIQALSSCQDAARQASEICLSLIYACLHQGSAESAFKLCTSLANNLFQLHHGLLTLEQWMKEQLPAKPPQRTSPKPKKNAKKPKNPS